MKLRWWLLVLVLLVGCAVGVQRLAAAARAWRGVA
jgi:hypothetical protein